jgi:hypothetical protein
MALAEQDLGEVNSLVQNADALVQNVAGVVVARREVIEYSVVSVLAGGHLLLNDLPGVGKTLLARWRGRWAVVSSASSSLRTCSRSTLLALR